MKFYEKLDYLMKQFNIKNIAELSLRTGISDSTLRNFYKRSDIKPSIQTLNKFTEFFNISTEYLTNDEITDPQFNTKKSNFEMLDLVINSSKTVEEIAEILNVSKLQVTSELVKIYDKINLICPETNFELLQARKELESELMLKIKMLSPSDKLKIEGMIDIYCSQYVGSKKPK